MAGIYFIKKSDINSQNNYTHITTINNIQFYHSVDDIQKSYISQIQYINLQPHILFKSKSPMFRSDFGL